MRIAQASSDCAFAQSDDGFAIIRCPFTELYNAEYVQV